PRADVAAAAAGLMFQTEPMFLEFEKFFVSPEHLGGTLFAGDRKLVFSMRQDFLEMSRSRHSFENYRLQAPISRELSISNHQKFEAPLFELWLLEFLWSLGFGIWRFFTVQSRTA